MVLSDRSAPFKRALSTAREARLYRRIEAVLLVAYRRAHPDAGRSAGIRFLWLPKQAPELNAMDQLWRELKRLIAADRQATSVNALASDAADWVLRLTPQQARRKAGMASKHFWLRNLVNDFLITLFPQPICQNEKRPLAQA